MVKVLAVSWFYHPKVGGVESVSKIINDNIVKRGHKVTVLTSGEKEEIDWIDGVKVIRIPEMTPGTNVDEKVREKIKNLILEENCDLVHGHNLSYPFDPKKSLEIISICKELKIKIIEHAHNAQLKTPEKTKKVILSDWDKIICVSDFVKKKLIEIGVDKNKLVIISNLLDSDLFNLDKIDENKRIELREKISPEGDTIIFFPGRVVRMSALEIGEQKQFKTVVSGLKKLKEKKIKFKLLIPNIKTSMDLSNKNGDKREKLVIDFIKEKGIYEDTYIFEKDLKLKDMPFAYAVSDIVCLPSLGETFGMVHLEAQSMGKPVIGAISGGTTEVVEDKKTGFLIKEKNENELAIYLEKLIKNKDLGIEMGKSGKKRVEELFSKEKILDELLKIYKDILR